MDIAKLKEDPLYNDARYRFIPLVKERFRKKSDETLEKFQVIVEKCLAKEIDSNNLISEVNTLFKGHPDLISKVSHFIPQDLRRSTSIKQGANKYVILDKEFDNSIIKVCLDYANQVRRTLQDDNEFNTFVEVIIRFREHVDIDRMRKEAFALVREHPGLEIELSRFIAATMETRPMRPRVDKNNGLNFFAFYEDRSKEEAIGGGGRKRLRSKHETQLDKFENKMYECERLFHSVKSARRAAKNLILGNLKGGPEEEILMGKYFSILNVKCLEELELDIYLSNEMKTRYEVIRRSKELAFILKMKKGELKKIKMK